MINKTIKKKKDGCIWQHTPQSRALFSFFSFSQLLFLYYRTILFLFFSYKKFKSLLTFISHQLIFRQITEPYLRLKKVEGLKKLNK
jgi:predicted membrane channel-forming protein YqfA (hemolysin III family)